MRKKIWRDLNHLIFASVFYRRTFCAFLAVLEAGSNSAPLDETPYFRNFVLHTKTAHAPGI